MTLILKKLLSKIKVTLSQNVIRRLCKQQMAYIVRSIHKKYGTMGGTCLQHTICCDSKPQVLGRAEAPPPQYQRSTVD